MGTRNSRTAWIQLHKTLSEGKKGGVQREKSGEEGGEREGRKWNCLFEDMLQGSLVG